MMMADKNYKEKHFKRQNKFASKFENKKLLMGKSSSFIEFRPKMKQITRGKLSSFIKFGPNIEQNHKGQVQQFYQIWALN